MSKKNSLFICLIISWLAFEASAQNSNKIPKESRLLGNSPYSSIGIGEVLPSNNLANDAMGGTGLTFGNGIYINTANPAMLVKNRYLAFSAGLRSSIKNLNDGTSAQSDYGMNLSHLAFAFPIKSRWSMSIGVRPYSIVEHEARYQQNIVGSTNAAEYTYRGKGGISKATWSNGFLIGKSLYAGFETNFYFGSFTRDTTSRLLLNDGQDYYLRYSERTAPKGSSFKAGLTWQQKISKKWYLNMGGTHEFGTNLKSEKLRSFSTLVDAGQGPQIIKSPDTLAILSGKYSIPQRTAIGISLESPLKWIFAAEYAVQDWAKFQNFDGKSLNYLTKSQTFSFGIETIPNATSTKYLNQGFYRIGFQSSKTPFLIGGTQVKDNSFTFGASIPLAYRSPSYIDFGFGVGRRGEIGKGLVQENYFKISVGFSFMDTRWFAKPKID